MCHKWVGIKVGVWENDIVRDLSVRKAMNAAFWEYCIGGGCMGIGEWLKMSGI